MVGFGLSRGVDLERGAWTRKRKGQKSGSDYPPLPRAAPQPPPQYSQQLPPGHASVQGQGRRQAFTLAEPKPASRSGAMSMREGGGGAGGGAYGGRLNAPKEPMYDDEREYVQQPQPSRQRGMSMQGGNDRGYSRSKAPKEAMYDDEREYTQRPQQRPQSSRAVGGMPPAPSLSIQRQDPNKGRMAPPPTRGRMQQGPDEVVRGGKVIFEEPIRSSKGGRKGGYALTRESASVAQIPIRQPDRRPSRR